MRGEGAARERQGTDGKEAMQGMNNTNTNTMLVLLAGKEGPGRGAGRIRGDSTFATTHLVPLQKVLVGDFPCHVKDEDAGVRLVVVRRVHTAEALLPRSVPKVLGGEEGEGGRWGAWAVGSRSERGESGCL